MTVAPTLSEQPELAQLAALASELETPCFLFFEEAGAAGWTP